jgi:hypothetical protein
MVIVPKPSQSKEIRITIDSKKANKAIKRTRHNTPSIECLADQLNGAAFMSKLDFRGGFHQLVLHKDSRSITTFPTPLGLMRYKRLSMGVCCASEIFQHEIEKALEGLIGVRNLVDDIFVWGSTIEEHDENLFKLLHRLTREVRVPQDRTRVLRTQVLGRRRLVDRRQDQVVERSQGVVNSVRATQLLGTRSVLWQTHPKAGIDGKATMY